MVNAAVERGETFESMGAGKASQKDLSYYVLEIQEECATGEEYSAGVVAGALFAIWTDE